jgi:hypothetical protein
MMMITTGIGTRMMIITGTRVHGTSGTMMMITGTRDGTRIHGANHGTVL